VTASKFLPELLFKYLSNADAFIPDLNAFGVGHLRFAMFYFLVAAGL